MNAESAYECATCGETFEDFEEAAHCFDCCYDVILCGECWRQWKTEYEAERCCQEGENEQ